MAKKKKSSGKKSSAKKTPKEVFPYRKEDERALTDGLQVLRARYYQGLKSTARSILQEVASENDGERPHNLEELILDRVHSSSNAITSIAYWAYHQDLLEALEELDLDDFFPEEDD